MRLTTAEGPAPERRIALARRALFLLATLCVTLVTNVGNSEAAPPPDQNGSAPGLGQEHRNRPVCPPAASSRAKCSSHILTEDDGVTPLATVTPSPGAHTPADIRAAYNLPVGAGQTVAVVNAHASPNAESDLAAYRSHFGLPPCTTADGCFKKANQRGGDTMPTPEANWALESVLDIQMVSAACPNCKIVLVLADSASLADLGIAVDTAANLFKANAISNSYGAREFSSQAFFEGHYNHPGTAITAAAGDSGFGVLFPAASRYVTAVGGTSLRRDTTTPRGWSETAWRGTGSGCSAYVPKPSWQTDTGCSRRTVNDVSAVADPATGVAVYASYGSTGGANWHVLGGTSVGSPLVAATYALAGVTPGVSDGSSPYAHSGGLNDVTSGSNGSCSPAYLCNAQAGYDGPTGLGTPNGTSAFGPATAPATQPTPFVTSFTPTNVRSDFSGWVGSTVRVGAKDLQVSALGRAVVAGNSATHTVKLVDAATGIDVAGGSATVATAGAPGGSFRYGNVASPVTLRANATYYVVTQETLGGDTWYDYDTRLVTTTAAADTGVVYASGATGSWVTGVSPNSSYGPVNFLYATAGATTTTTSTAPPTSTTSSSTTTSTAPPTSTTSSSTTTSTAPPTSTTSSSTTSSSTPTTAVPAATPFVSSFSPTNVRNDFSGWVGSTVRVGEKDLQVSALGRAVVAGNSATHTVKLVDGATGNDVAGGSATVATAGAPAGSFRYGNLAAPVTLRANATYYVVTQETLGGDAWYDYDTRLVTTSAATDTGVVYATGATGTWVTGVSPNSSYGPVNFLYA